MSDCYGSKDVENEMKQDGGGFTQGSFNNAADTDTAESSVPDAEADAISQKVNTANSINENIGSAPAGGSVRLTQTDEKAIGRMASTYIKKVNKYRENEEKAVVSNFKNLTGRIAKTMNLYTRISSGLARKFTDKMAPVYMFLARTFPVQGRSVMEHPVVSAIQDGLRTVSGLRSGYSEQLDNIRKLTRKYLRDSVISTNKALELIGDRLNLSQMSVHTDIILRNWDRRMQEIKKIAEDEHSRYRILTPISGILTLAMNTRGYWSTMNGSQPTATAQDHSPMTKSILQRDCLIMTPLSVTAKSKTCLFSMA